MSTHNIGFYEEISKIITYHQISSNTHLISSADTNMAAQLQKLAGNLTFLTKKLELPFLAAISSGYNYTAQVSRLTCFFVD